MSSQRGSVGSFFLVACWTIALFCLAIASDIGRMLIYREQMRNAADAAALAGAMQVNRIVRVTLEREVHIHQTCADEKGNEYDCSYWADVDPYVGKGFEWQWWDSWPQKRSELCGGDFRCLSEKWECRIEPKTSWNAVKDAADLAFQKNADGQGWKQYLAGPVVPSFPRGDTLKWDEFYVDIGAAATFPAVFWLDNSGVTHTMTVQSGRSRASLVRRDRPADPALEQRCVRWELP